MGAAARRLWAKAQTPEGLKVIKYTSVSAISSLTSIVVLALVFGVLKLGTEVWCTLFANVVAGIPAYVLNRRWVWGKRGRSHLWREIVPFWVMSFSGVGLALFTSSLAHDFAQTHQLHHLARTMLVEGANIAAFGTLWFLKFLVLNRLFAQIAEVELHDSEVVGDFGTPVASADATSP